MDLIQLKLCDIQGRLFELSLQAGYDSEDFMKRFMRSKVARDLDSEYNRMQWAGEEYLLEEFADEIDGWVIDELKRVGCDTAKSVLELSEEELESRTDLEIETIRDVLSILKAEFE